MHRALELARTAAETPGTSPIGAVLVCDGEIIGEGYNQVGQDHDPTAHAEIVTMRRAGQHVGASRFAGATLYSTLQPCGMCTMAAIWAGVRTIVYGAERGQVHEMYFEDRHFDIMDYLDDAYRDDMTIKGGVLAQECAALCYGPDDDPPREAMGNLPPVG
ncbi:MAG: nucleoside deaminase [Acidiphilium sp.]|nr:nucleoside deaminase [Acidiphilium sp.]